MYQLVLQFAADSIDYDAVIALEEQLIQELGESTVDGHDVGSGEANIFLRTADPQKTFRQLALLLERTGHIAVVTAAYRRDSDASYVVLWPEDSLRQFSIA